MKPNELDRASSVASGDYVVVQSTEGTSPALVPAESLSPSGFDPDRVRFLFKMAVYPVGSYIETDGTDPSTVLGGTWRQVFGKFLFATKSGYEYTDTSQIPSDAGRTVTLSASNLPSHSHSIALTHTHKSSLSWSHAHDYSHNHTFNSATVASHNHTYAAHRHNDGGHTHNTPMGLTVNATKGLEKSTTFKDDIVVTTSSAVRNPVVSLGHNTTGAGMCTTTSTTDVASLTSGSSGSLTMSTHSKATGSPVSIPTSSSTSANSVTGTMTSETYPNVSGYVGGSTGGGGAHENMPPYYATNIWKRVA